MSHQGSTSAIKNAISVDVEEYYHAHNLAGVAPRESWPNLSSRVEISTRLVLDLLDQQKIKATFFVLGLVAKDHPQLVIEIVARGHELASHGLSHRLVYEQSPQEFKEDVMMSKQILEQISGAKVTGYRAPSFSINHKTPWAYEILAEVGYLYDSSLYPVYHPRYANTAASVLPQTVNTSSGPLQILPLAVSVWHLGQKELRIPVAGGAYWRLFPECLLKRLLARINEREHRPFVAYFHPWELDKDQPVFTGLPLMTRVRHYGNITNFHKKLSLLLSSFSFAPLREIGP